MKGECHWTLASGMSLQPCRTFKAWFEHQYMREFSLIKLYANIQTHTTSHTRLLLCCLYYKGTTQNGNKFKHSRPFDWISIVKGFRNWVIILYMESGLHVKSPYSSEVQSTRRHHFLMTVICANSICLYLFHISVSNVIKGFPELLYFLICLYLLAISSCLFD